MSAIREIYDKLFSPFEIQMLKTGMLEDKILEFGRLCKNHIKHFRK
jgi:hydroxymethylpyrimidine/phosphomethylpyrimidine kinase